LRVVAQHRFDAALLVVSRNEEQQTGIRHTDSIAGSRRAINLGKQAKEVCNLSVC
jgi:hypothetical protein